MRQLVIWIALSACTATLAAQSTQRQDEDFATQVKQWTTKPEFLTPLVDHLPRVEGIPTPKDVLGYHIGTPQKLTHTAEIYKYYRALAAASQRVKVIEIGKTDEGRDCLVVFIGSEESIRNLEQHRANLAKLADPRTISPAQAQEIIAQTKPIYHLMAGLHSGETGPPEMLMELAYRLVAEDTPLLRKIRDNIIVSITPASEPDGRDRYVDWYYLHKINEKTEDDRIPGPPYWGKYIFHDNNRDMHYSQVSMRNILQWYLQWHPPIMHDLHESVPFLYTFSGQAPQNPTLDPILYAELPWFSNYEMTTAMRYGLPGVWTHAFVDMWSPGYLGFMSSNHNGILRMYETFGNGGANTMKRKVVPADTPPGPNSVTSRQWYRPRPPYAEVEWSMRNNTNYMQTMVLAALDLTSSFPQVVLDNFYRKSRNSIESGREEAPFGYVIPAGQKDMNRVAWVVNTLRLQGIEVGRSTAGFEVKEGKFGDGSFVIKRDQPYGRLAKILLEKQNFPDPALRTYDDTGWTMGLLAGVTVQEIADKAVLGVAVQPVDKLEWKGTLSGFPARSAYVIPHNGANALITLRCRLRDLKFEAAEKPFAVNGTNYPAGSFLIPVQGPNENLHQRIKLAVEELGLQAVALENMPEVARHELEVPRLAVFSTWGNTQEVGWVRHALDMFEVPYELIYKERIKAGKLREAYDVILIPSQGRSAKGLVYDVDSRDRALPYKKSEKYPSLGMYGESDDISGGMGLAGVLELEKFSTGGGTLITLGAASYFPPEFGLTKRVEAMRPSSQFYAPGPIIEAQIERPEHPLFYGYTGKTLPVRYANGPLLVVPEQDKGQVLMKFTGADKSVLSGLMRGVTETRNRAAIVDVASTSGRVIVFATNPCYRWQNHGEFNLLFNAILNFNDKP
ncbi:MAG: hypothetical protein JNL62_16315 [Bryobacterales bacterium]|nr:hypothetical protein [Bryobacterales bacterium]